MKNPKIINIKIQFIKRQLQRGLISHGEAELRITSIIASISNK